jgi:SAM-dependent methyltransferase
MMKVLTRFLEHSSVYRLWQRPFAAAKFAPVLAANRFESIRRVLDVGCGPGTNAGWFAHTEYLGLDWNPRYIEAARKRHKGNFIVADVTRYNVTERDRFDFILVNSLLHHLDDEATGRLLRHLSGLLAVDGHVHILELVRPDRSYIAGRLAEWDRGDFPRPLDHWRAIFNSAFQPVLFQPYSVGIGGVALWEMVYFKGSRLRQ